MKGDLTEKQFQEIVGIIYNASGINLKDKRAHIDRKIFKILKNSNYESVDKYIKAVKNDPTELIRLVDMVSINWTYFLRENEHCEYVLANIPNSESLSIWSAACSTGEEPYSIAIQLLDNAYRFKINATDISDTVLETARKGIYSKDKITKIPTDILKKYFKQGQSKWEGYVQVKKSVRSLITFNKINLLENFSAGPYDVVFLQKRDDLFRRQDETKSPEQHLQHDQTRRLPHARKGGSAVRARSPVPIHQAEHLSKVDKKLRRPKSGPQATEPYVVRPILFQYPSVYF